MSIPAILDRDGVEQVLDIPLNAEELKNLTASAAALQKVLDDIAPDLEVC